MKKIQVVAKARVTRYQDVVCTNCKVDLTPAMPETVDENGLWSNLQAKDALSIAIDGGYGMKIDPVESFNTPNWRGYQAIFCTKCADELFEKFPSLRLLVGEPSYEEADALVKNKS